jgi:hypothetical protein
MTCVNAAVAPARARRAVFAHLHVAIFAFSTTE